MDTPTSQITARFTTIPERDRQIFDRFYAEQLSAALQRAEAEPLGIDEERVERQLIDTLIRQAEGRDHPHALGRVPSATRTYDIRIPERDPRLAQGVRRVTVRSANASAMSPARWAVAGIVVFLLLGSGLWSLLSRRPPTEASAETPPAAMNPAAPTAPPSLPTTFGELGEAGAVTVSDPTSLEIRRPDGSSVVLRVVPSSSVLGGSWTPSVEKDQAAWLAGTVINSVFCLPSSAESLIGSLKRGSTILLRPASGERRRYEVVRVRTVGRQQVEVLDQRRAGMTLLRCGTAGSTRTVVEAVYRPDTMQQPTHAVHTPAALARVEVQAVEVITPTADLPPGLSLVELRVEVTNLSTGELPWTDLADQLEVGGSVAEVVPTVPEAPLDPQETRTVSYRYRVPNTGGDALWRVTAATGDSLTVRVPIPTVSAVRPIQTVLQAEDVRHIGAGQAARLAITARVTTTGPAPVTLDTEVVGCGRAPRRSCSMPSPRPCRCSCHQGPRHPSPWWWTVPPTPLRSPSRSDRSAGGSPSPERRPPTPTTADHRCSHRCLRF